jgi:hypothetical protein
VIGFFAILAVSLQSVAVPPVYAGAMPDDMRFKGGPYAGLGVGQSVTPEGRAFRGLLPSDPAAAPLRAQDQAAIQALVDGRLDPQVAPLAAYLARRTNFENCTKLGQSCAAGKTLPIKFVEPVTARFYVLGNDRVRVEWLYGNALFYLSFVDLKDGKIQHVMTMPAWLPLNPKGGRN